MELDQRRCKELFTIKDSCLIRNKNVAPNAKEGTVAGWWDKGVGYYRVRIDKRIYLVHRVIYLMVFGWLPEYVDHKDGNTRNNSPSNLRAVSKKQNRWNSKGNDNTFSGVKGVYKDRSRWKALVTISGEKYYLGMYETVEEAEAVVNLKYSELQGVYAKNERGT